MGVGFADGGRQKLKFECLNQATGWMDVPLSVCAERKRSLYTQPSKLLNSKPQKCHKQIGKMVAF